MSNRYTSNDNLFTITKPGTGIITTAKLEQAKVASDDTGWKLLDVIDIDWNKAKFTQYIQDKTITNPIDGYGKFIRYNNKWCKFNGIFDIIGPELCNLKLSSYSTIIDTLSSKNITFSPGNSTPSYSSSNAKEGGINPGNTNQFEFKFDKYICSFGFAFYVDKDNTNIHIQYCHRENDVDTLIYETTFSTPQKGIYDTHYESGRTGISYSEEYELFKKGVNVVKFNKVDNIIRIRDIEFIYYVEKNNFECTPETTCILLYDEPVLEYYYPSLHGHVGKYYDPSITEISDTGQFVDYINNLETGGGGIDISDAVKLENFADIYRASDGTWKHQGDTEAEDKDIKQDEDGFVTTLDVAKNLIDDEFDISMQLDRYHDRITQLENHKQDEILPSSVITLNELNATGVYADIIRAWTDLYCDGTIEGQKVKDSDGNILSDKLDKDDVITLKTAYTTNTHGVADALDVATELVKDEIATAYVFNNHENRIEELEKYILLLEARIAALEE